MVISEWKWESCQGMDLYARSWEPEFKPKASIMLVHGHGEHVTRFDQVAAALTDRGYAMLGFDLCGHGKSGGQRGHIQSYEGLMDDVASFLGQAKERYAGLPQFLYGHSMGGNLVLNYALRRNPDLRGVIATGPWLKLAFQPPAIQLKLGRLMKGLYPAFSQHSKLDTKGLSHDQAVINAYENDPLVHDNISARLFMEIYETGLWALDHAAEFPLPLLLMHGGADPITSAKASQEFARKAGDKVTFKIWDGMYHEIHNELEQAQVFAYMLDWLDKH
jgi:alpha-beta hydrolase superfamily lysophospholipase